MKNRPQVVAMLLFIFLILAITLTIFFATKEGRDVRSRAQAVPLCTGAVTNFVPNDQCPSAATDQYFKSATITCDTGETLTIGAASNVTGCISITALKAEAQATCQKKCLMQSLPSGSPTSAISQLVVTPTPKCDFGSMQVRGLCGTPAPAIDQVKSNYGDYTCLSGVTGTVGDANTCRSFAELAVLARQACVANCTTTNVTPTQIPVPTITCREGVRESRQVLCDMPTPELVATVPPFTAAVTPGANTTIPTPIPPILIKVQGMIFTCLDGSVEKYPTDMSPSACYTPEEFAKRLDELMRGGWVPCKGKLSPACAALSGTPSPTGSLTPLPTGPTCSSKSKGDCNCDTKMDIIDFECWRKQYNGEALCQSADFNSDAKCNLNDFEILRQNLFKTSTN